MKSFILLCFAITLLAACSQRDSGVRVSTVAVEKPDVEARQPRTEPIFYNGKTYTLKFAPDGQGHYDMAVLGLGAKQQKDATNIAISAIRYFACPDGKRGTLTEQPRFEGATWKMSARCA